MKELLDNATEFLMSGEENLNKNRYNAAASDYFKAIVILCDYLIYREIKLLPKNHTERFSLLKNHFRDIYIKVSGLFKLYTDSYNIKLKKEDVIKIKDYANEIKNYISNKK